MSEMIDICTEINPIVAPKGRMRYRWDGDDLVFICHDDEDEAKAERNILACIKHLQYEDEQDRRLAQEALEEAKREGTVPWEEVKERLKDEP